MVETEEVVEAMAQMVLMPPEQAELAAIAVLVGQELSPNRVATVVLVAPLY